MQGFLERNKPLLPTRKLERKVERTSALDNSAFPKNVQCEPPVLQTVRKIAERNTDIMDYQLRNVNRQIYKSIIFSQQRYQSHNLTSCKATKSPSHYPNLLHLQRKLPISLLRPSRPTNFVSFTEFLSPPCTTLIVILTPTVA